jgi:hypothetical protein
MLEEKKMFTVNLWGSHPDHNNDDCWTGYDCETLEEALDCLNNPWKYFDKDRDCDGTAYFELDSEERHELVGNPEFNERLYEDDCRDWKQEFAMQNGMAFGVDGYNDAMGY